MTAIALRNRRQSMQPDLPPDWSERDCFACWRLGIELAAEQVQAGGEVPQWLSPITPLPAAA